MVQQQHQELVNGKLTEESWWTHRRLLEEAEIVLTCPSAESIIISCIKDARELAQDLLTVTSGEGGGDSTAVIDAKLVALREGLIRVQNQLLDALVANQREQQETSTEESEVVTQKERQTCDGKYAGACRTSYQMLLHAVIDEWARKQWSAAAGDGGSSHIGYIMDSFLTDVAFTDASKWNKTDADSMLDVVYSFVVGDLGMTLIEQERLLPMFVKHSWDAFLLELQGLEDEVWRVCVVWEEGGVLDSGGEEEVAHKRHSAARALVLRAAQVLKMLTIAPSPGSDGDAAAGKPSQRGHVAITTSSKAKFLVESLGRWLPPCGNFFRSMLPLRHHEKKKLGNCGDCGNDDAEHVAGGGGHLQAASITERVENTAVTLEAREWIRRLQQQVQRVFMQLAQFEETSPWTLVLADITARAFYIARDHVNDKGENAENNKRQHVAMKTFMAWHHKAGDAHGSYPAADAGGEGGIPPRALVEACGMNMDHILPCEQDTQSCPGNISIRVLRLLLVQRPVATLRHFLSSSLCPFEDVAAACDYDAAITEKGQESNARATAFSEEPLEGNGVARAFFPKYLVVFNCIEQAMSSLCDSLAAACTTDNNDFTGGAFSQIVEQFIAAALDEAFSGYAHCGTAASEWLMFLAFLCSETPVFNLGTLQHVRRAALRFFSPGRMMMMYLHRQIVQLQRRGLVAFFLPPLRAIGVDYSTSTDHEHVGCALRYPISAEVAYFQELPRGYYVRQPLGLALNAKNDALHFFHKLLMFPMASISSKEPPIGVVAQTSEEENNVAQTSEEDNRVVYDLFIDIVAHVGAVAAARVRGEADRRPVEDPATVDAMASVFFGILRLCSSVTCWDAARRHDVQRAIVKRVCDLSKTHSSASRAARASATTMGSAEDGDISPQLPMEYLLRGGCTLSEANEPGDNSKVCATSTAASASALGGDYIQPHAWHDWFCAVEFEDIDGRAWSCAMALFRSCNRKYMKYIPTKTLLAHRSTLEQHAVRGRESETQMRTLTAMEAAIQKDVQVLREQWRCKGEVVQQEQKGQSKQVVRGLMVNENDDADVAGDVVKMEAMDASTEPPADSDAEAVVVAIAEAATTDGIDANGGDNGKDDGGAQSPYPQDERPLPLTAVKSYIETVIVLLMQRACISVVDGVAAGVALTKWLVAVTGKLEAQVLLEVVRWVVLKVNTKLRHTTKLECASLSAFLGVIIEDVVLPYKLSFFAARHTDRKHPNKQQGQRQSHVNVSAEVPEGGNSSEWIRHSLPASEKDAVTLLRVLIADTTRTVTQFLKEATPLGDWRAYKLALHTRRIMGLVKSYVVTFRMALDNRLQELDATSTTGASSVHEERMHPVRLLAALECPLLEGMLSPSVDVNHLFTPASKTEPKATGTNSASRLPLAETRALATSNLWTKVVSISSAETSSGRVGNGGGHNSNGGGNRDKWTTSSDAFKRKRHRSAEDYHHSQRHGGRKKTPRENLK